MEGQGRGKQKVVAGILGILLGGFGVHHFYLGSTMAGVIQIIATLVTCGAASLVGLVEGILLIVMNDADFDARYNQRTPGSTEFVFMKPQP
jgi:TM2 domain-containing membrane protein YozV